MAALPPALIETLRIIHLDAAGAVVGITEHCSQARDRVDVSLRRVIGDALRLEAHVLVLVHNHPYKSSSITLDHAQAH